VLIATISNDVTPPITGFEDTGQAPVVPATPPPYQYDSPSSVSNLYSAFLHQNSTTNPATGMSINGLVYGFPFDHDGYFSTKIQYPSGSYPSTVTFALNGFTPLDQVFRVAFPASATAGVAFVVTAFAQTGTTLAFASSDATAVLAADYTFLATDGGSHTFQITLNRAGSQTITVTDVTTGQAQKGVVVVSAGAATHIAFVNVPGFEFVRRKFPVQVEALDAFGNVASTASGMASLTRQGVRQSLQAAFYQGIATFNMQVAKSGRSIFVAHAFGGRASSAPISVSGASGLGVRSPRKVQAGYPFQATIVARMPGGRRDLYYQGTVDVYSGGALIGVGAATNGLAQVELTLGGRGKRVLIARDSQKPGVAGRVSVTIARSTPGARELVRFPLVRRARSDGRV